MKRINVFLTLTVILTSRIHNVTMQDPVDVVDPGIQPSGKSFLLLTLRKKNKNKISSV